jgi:hypothetical protein
MNEVLAVQVQVECIDIRENRAENIRILAFQQIIVGDVNSVSWSNHVEDLILNNTKHKILAKYERLVLRLSNSMRGNIRSYFQSTSSPTAWMPSFD